jgi:hypothetical protein
MSIIDKINLILILMVIIYLVWMRFGYRIEVDLERDRYPLRATGIRLWLWNEKHTRADLVLRIPLRRKHG